MAQHQTPTYDNWTAFITLDWDWHWEHSAPAQCPACTEAKEAPLEERRLKLSMHYYVKTRACIDNPAHHALHEFDRTTRDLYAPRPKCVTLKYVGWKTLRLPFYAKSIALYYFRAIYMSSNWNYGLETTRLGQKWSGPLLPIPLTPNFCKDITFCNVGNSWKIHSGTVRGTSSKGVTDKRMDRQTDRVWTQLKILFSLIQNW